MIINHHLYTIQVSSTLNPCWGHSVTAVTLAPGLTEVTMFGGSADEWKGSADKQPTLADTKVLQFGEFIKTTVQQHVYTKLWLQVYSY